MYNVLLDRFYHKVRTDYTEVHKSLKKGHVLGQEVISQRALSFRYQEESITITIKHEALFPPPPPPKSDSADDTPMCKLSILGTSRSGSLKGKRKNGFWVMR